MNIGFISAWCEQGAGYVTKQYIDLLSDKHNIFVYARGNAGDRRDDKWNQDFVTWGKKTPGTMCIVWKDLKKWIVKNNLHVLFFNEQQDMSILAEIKKSMPHLIIGAYIDYYKRNTIRKHEIYDFLICNTKRHFETFEWHPQCYYVPWGTDVELYSYEPHKEAQFVTFFHSMGNSDRKGTLALLDVFINTDLYKKSQLVLHTQVKSEWFKKQGYDYEELSKKNVKIIEKTVTAPGLYYLGDVYVYPAELDGLGLTIYEALSSGLPVIGTDVPPINEPINDINGRKVKVEKHITREDGYYWPLSIIDKSSLYEQMKYYIDNQEKLLSIRDAVRIDAVKKLNWKSRKEQVLHIFETVKVQRKPSQELLNELQPHKSIGQKLDWIITYVYMYFVKH